MNIDESSLYAVIVTLITVLGSTSAFRFYEKKILLKQKRDNFTQDDYRERIEKLEILLEKSSIEKDAMRAQILKLTEQVSTLRVKVEYLEKENKELIKNRKEKV